MGQVGPMTQSIFETCSTSALSNISNLSFAFLYSQVYYQSTLFSPNDIIHYSLFTIPSENVPSNVPSSTSTSNHHYLLIPGQFWQGEIIPSWAIHDLLVKSFVFVLWKLHLNARYCTSIDNLICWLTSTSSTLMALQLPSVQLSLLFLELNVRFDYI